ncbi:MAG: DUF459 domain-containing protein [Acidimicrobiales bacterium]
MKSRKVYHASGTDRRWKGPGRDAGGHFLASERRDRVRLIVIVLVVGLLVLAITAVLSRQPDDELRIDYIDVESQQAPGDSQPQVPMALTITKPTVLMAAVSPIADTQPAQSEPAQPEIASPSEDIAQPEPVPAAPPTDTAAGGEASGGDQVAPEPGVFHSPDAQIDPADPATIDAIVATIGSGPTAIVRTPSGDDPLTVYVGGDSLSDAPRWGLDQADANISVTGDTHISTGIVNRAFYDWPGRVANYVAPEGFDVVVLTMGGNDAQRFVYEHDVASPEWNAEYRSRVNAIFSSLSGGPLVIWIGMPPVQPANIKPAIEAANQITSELAAGYDHVEYVDAYSMFVGPEGGFALNLEGPDGRSHQVRAGDGVHYTTTAGAWLADAVLDVIANRMEDPGSLRR